MSVSNLLEENDLNIHCGILTYKSLDPPVSEMSANLSHILTNGNDATGQDIVNVSNMTCQTLNYTSLNPPIAEES